MVRNILVVCVGNICRSPALERMLKKGLPKVSVRSAGLHAVVGRGIDPSMRNLLLADGQSSDGHVACQLVSHMLTDADLIIVMERQHINELCKRSPSVRGKTMLASHWLDQADVADPYRGSPEVFQKCFQQLKACSQGWLEKLS